MKSKISDVMKSLDNINRYDIPAVKPALPKMDNRSRAERREDLEKELSEIDKKTLLELKEKILNANDPDKLFIFKNDIENTTIKFLRYIDKYEELNSIESRKVDLKEKELQLEAKHDWAEKTRLFFFRILATILFISSLFIIGYIEHTYDWARLPLSKYIKNSSVPDLK